VDTQPSSWFRDGWEIVKRRQAIKYRRDIKGKTQGDIMLKGIRSG